MSKKLDSILSKVPHATIGDQKQSPLKPSLEKEKITKIVGYIPVSLKNEIKDHISNNKGETVTAVVLRGLKAIGFNVKEEWIVDKRTLR